MSKRLNTSSSKRPDVSTDSLLDHVPLLNILSPQDRQRILPELSETRYGKDDFIFREGDPTEYFHIVKEGTVKCVKSTANGKECTLKMLMPGDLFCCDAAAFDGGCHPGTAQPMGNVSILRMHRKAYFDMLKRNPDAAMEVIKYLGNRLNEAQEKAKILALDRADQRLGGALGRSRCKKRHQGNSGHQTAHAINQTRHGEYDRCHHGNRDPHHEPVQTCTSGLRHR